MQHVTAIDAKLTEELFSRLPHTSFLNIFFSFFSFIEGSVLIWLLIITAIALFVEKRKKSFIIFFSASLLFTYWFVEMFLKNIFMRVRPDILDRYRLLGDLPYSCPTDFSFPSGHAAVAFASSVLISHYDKKHRYFYHGIALIISFSRIYLGCHFLLDVAVGGLIGAIISNIIIQRIIAYRKKKIDVHKD
ncbi:MAG: phosphatase PAP2 family protein [Patescibacteria group bacterium]